MILIKLKIKLKSMLQEFDNYVEKHVDTALKITTELKKLLVSPAADILVAIIPSGTDNRIREQLVNALDKGIEALTIAEKCKQFTDTNEKLKCFIQQMQLRDPLLQDAVLQKLASFLAGFLDGFRLKQSLYDLYTQAKYSVQYPEEQNNH